MEPKGYTDKTAVQNYLLQTIADTFDNQLDEWIAGVEIIIDQYTGRNFIADETATARLYDGDGEQDLLIDEAVDVTKVEVGGDSYGSTFAEVGATGADRYFEYPENHTAIGRPITKLSLSARAFTEGRQNNRITAKWGYSVEVPADIKLAATVFVAGILNQHRQGGDQIKTEKIGNYQVTYNTDQGEDSWADYKNAMAILDRYKKYRI